MPLEFSPDLSIRHLISYWIPKSISDITYSSDLEHKKRPLRYVSSFAFYKKGINVMPSGKPLHRLSQVKCVIDYMSSRGEQYIHTYDVHNDVIKWKHFQRYWPFVRGIHRSPVNSPHKGQWRGALMLSLICVWIDGWVKKSWGWWLGTSSRPSWRHCSFEGGMRMHTLLTKLGYTYVINDTHSLYYFSTRHSGIYLPALWYKLRSVQNTRTCYPG